MSTSSFCMPSLGADMDEGKLVEWLVKPGDAVKRGDLIAVVETSKAAVEVEVWEDGVITELCVEPGTTVEVGGVLAKLEVEGEGSGPSTAPLPGQAPASKAPTPAPAQPPPTPTSGVRASPRARKRARELGVDIADVPGSGPHKRISTEDVELAARAQQTEEPALRLRRSIAAAMERSKREIPHYYLGLEVDLSAALKWLTETNTARPIAERLLPAVLILKAVALAAREAPDMNGVFTDGMFLPAEGVHLGVAVSLRGGGLVAPAIHDADQRPLTDLMRAFRDLVNRARAGRLRGSELTDPTLTVTSLGDQGVDAVYGVIQPPQVAIVGVGRVREVPRVVDGAVVPRSAAQLTLSADHRVSDGLGGARFLAHVAQLLQAPEAL